MKKTLKILFSVLAVILVLASITIPAFAANEEETDAVVTSAEATEAAEETESEVSDSTKTKIIAAAALIAVVAGLGAVAMGWAITNAGSNIARQPEAAGNIRTNVMLGLVFIETAIIYALIVAILIIFVL